jgi:hypothetical protein
MSDDYLIIVPADPRLIPSPDAVEQVLSVLEDMAPDAETMDTMSSEVIQFFDCGQNFESVSCPKCSATLDMDWWHERMDEDHGEGGFQLHSFPTPCCQATVTLNDLTYDWPQSFGRFCWEVENPDVGDLDDAAIDRLTSAAGFPLRIIRQHI